MIVDFLLKPILIFIVGAFSALVVYNFVSKSDPFNFNPKGKAVPKELGVSTTVPGAPDKKVGNVIVDTVFNKVLPAITQNQAFDPLVQTKQDIEKTVNAVTSLPQEQKEAICKQVCTP